MYKKTLITVVLLVTLSIIIGIPAAKQPDSASILQERTNIQNEIPSLTSNLPQDHYAGVYVKAAENKVVIQLVNGTPEIRAQIVKQAKFPSSIEFEEVDFTLAQIQDAMSAVKPQTNNNPSIVLTVADLMKNKIAIWFRVSEEDSRQLRQKIEQLVNPNLLVYRYNQEITVEYQADRLLIFHNPAVTA